METSNALRIGAILALFLGAIYVLLPTLLQAESESALANTAQQVNTPSGAKSDPLDLRLGVKGAPAAEAANALQTRLAYFGVAVREVKVDGDQIRVALRPGTSADAVLSAANRPIRVGLHPVSLLPEAPVPEGATAASLLQALPPEVASVVGAGVGEDVALAARVSAALEGGLPSGVGDVSPLVGGASFDSGSGRVVLGSVPAEPLGLTLVSADGRLVGLGPVEVIGDLATLPVAVAPAQAADFAVLASGPVPGELFVAPTAEVSLGEGPVAESAGSDLPPWLVGVLPDTKMPLGLDLQGGIDLTLQVELEQAVMSRANRDRSGLAQDIETTFGGGGTSADKTAAGGFFAGCNGADQIAGSELDAAWQQTVVRVDPDEPIISVESSLPLAEIQNFVLQRLDAYAYTETSAGEGDRQIHAFSMREDAIEGIHREAVDQVLDTLRRRIDETGVKEPTIVKKGGGRINVQLPGMVNLQAAVDAIGTTAVLEFMLVDEDLEDSLRAEGFEARSLPMLIDEAKAAMPAEQFADDGLVNRWLRENRKLPESRLVRWEYDESDPKAPVRTTSAYALKVDNNPLTGADIDDAGVSFDQSQQPLVTMSFKRRGADKFCDLTSANVNKRFAILLDDKVMSAPNIKQAICGGRAQIEMGGSVDPQQEARTLALVLRTGSLNAPVSVGEVRIIGPSLGADAIRAGGIGALVGGALVLVFMALWYRTAGMVADIALVLNILLLLALLSLFGATLTLPGIAGIALTVGMAVDANIIIYERIREELRLGQLARKAVDAGFEKAIVAVLDANITTAIAGVVLFSYGTGPIKGFAVTLLIGIFTTLVASLFANRTMMELLTRSSSARLRI